MIPPGVRDGSVIRLAGQGEPGMNGGPPGDLRLHVRLKPHRLFQVINGRDLEFELPVAPWEAALGATVLPPDAAAVLLFSAPSFPSCGCQPPDMVRAQFNLRHAFSKRMRRKALDMAA
jgi:curved DNA-binding protein